RSSRSSGSGQGAQASWLISARSGTALDIVVIVIALVCAAFNIYRTISVGNKLTRLLEDETQYPDFDFLSFWQEQFNQAIAITVFFAWVKIFKYISFNKTMTQLSSTLGACAKDLLGFAVIWGYLIFGTKKLKTSENFSRPFSRCSASFWAIFDFASLQNAHRVLGPIYFILYVFFVFFPSRPCVLDKLHLRRATKIVDIQRAMQSADMNNDRQLDFEEWRTELKMRGYADGEIEALFARYDMDGDRVLDEDEQRKMQWELEGQKAALNSQIESERAEQQRQGSAGVGADDGDADNDELAGDDRDGAVSLRGSMRSATRGGRPNTSGSNSGRRRGSGVSVDEFTTLSRRVDRMEHSIGGIVNRIDSVLLKLESMERAKLKRRETMSRLLDSIGECEGDSEAEKREKMERMVRQELERWAAPERRRRPRRQRRPSRSTSWSLPAAEAAVPPPQSDRTVERE
uniref:EF-hand domain-containing protein n=1 Tax=Macrostomum lignano TaxID=282301 RepID=A0A1I8IZ99_9PLAT